MPAISYERGALGDRVAGQYRIDPMSQARERAFVEEKMGRVALDTAKWELQAKKEAWDAQKKQADTSGELATQFLSTWGGAMTDLKGMFGAAGENLSNVTKLLSGGEAGKMPDEMKSYLGTITDLQNMMKDQYTSYQAQFAPTEQEFLKGAREEMGARRTTTGRLLKAGEAKTEDAAMRAGTDVKLQAEIGEREAARELMSMGVDPSSGRFGALSRRSAIQSAGEQAKAMNQARIAEKNRATQVNIATMAALRPEQLAGVATNIRGEGTKMLGATAEIAKAGADILGKQSAIDLARIEGITKLGTAQAGLAGQYAQSVVQPFGEMAGYYLGKAGGAINPAGVSAALTPSAAPTARTSAVRSNPQTLSRAASESNDARRRALAQSQGTKGANYLYGIDTAEPQWN